MIVSIKLIVYKIEETPAKCNEIIIRCTDSPEYARFLAKDRGKLLIWLNTGFYY